MPDGQVGPARLSQEEVNYRQHEKCLACAHFYGPNSCDIVDGNISSEGVCVKWEVRLPTGPRDGAFFSREFTKANGVRA
ncbi:MAG: hypothetical protein ACW987_08960 [Candidatus Thorarchaeota archaeon]|jgi:hypothetical protein